MQPRGIFHLSFWVLTVLEIPAFASQIGGRWTILWCFERAINYISNLSPRLSEKIKIPFYNVVNNNIKQSGAESVAEMCFMNRNFTSSLETHLPILKFQLSRVRLADGPRFSGKSMMQNQVVLDTPACLVAFIGKTFQTQP